jgi:sarcosine oxidase, subunit beta
VIGPFRKLRAWSAGPMRRRYDVVIVGGGVHGMAIAYELARRGVSDVAVIDRS